MLRLWLGMEILDMYKNMQDSFRLGFLTEHIDTLYANRVATSRVSALEGARGHFGRLKTSYRSQESEDVSLE